VSDDIDIPLGPARSDLELFLDHLHTGLYDTILVHIQSILDTRRDFLKDALRQRVKDLFGEDADIIVPGEHMPHSAPAEPTVPKPNPFIEKARGETPPGLPPDPMDELENKMSEEFSGDPFTRRGAVISGLHSSQMGI
jgi:hypothetical protein